jgi:hypothetical protein
MKLEEIKFQTPCSVPWEQMTGDDRVRLCGQCNKKVFNLSSMKRDDAERFMAKTQGSECIQFYKRPDGTIVTADCGSSKPLPTQLGGKPMPPPPPPPKPESIRMAGVPAQPPPPRKK